MTREMLLDALGKIDDKYILSSWNRAAAKPYRSRRITRRAALTAAVLILLLSSFTAAMAANEDFRNAVFRFFRISTPDMVLPMEDEPNFPTNENSVPELPPNGGSNLITPGDDAPNLVTPGDNAPNPVTPKKEFDMDSPAPASKIENIGKRDVEDALNVEYLRIQGTFDYRDGAVYLYEPWEGYDDDYDAWSSCAESAYIIKNGEPVPMEAHYETVSFTWDIPNSPPQDSLQSAGTQNGSVQSSALQGSGAADTETWKINFDWYEKDGLLYTNAKNYDPYTSVNWEVSASGSNPDFLILTFGFGWQTEYTQYSLLYNVRTKELLDVLAGCNLPEGLHITGTAFSPELSGMLLTCDYGSRVYYYDIASKSLSSLNELSGLEDLDASFIDDDTICCISADENRLYTCRTISILSGECTESFSSLPRLGEDGGSGIVLTGGRYGLHVDKNGNVGVYDFKTGELAAIETFRYPEHDAFMTANNAGDKILFTREDSEADGLGTAQIGVIDLAYRTFVLLDREGYETRRENSVSWFDNDRIAIRAAAEGYEYLYLFTISIPE